MSPRLRTGLFHLLRLVVIAVLLHRVLAWLLPAPEVGKPAGFGRGMIDGAFMPLAMPSLLLGRDIPIHAEVNTGRTYRLGYTVGVNACGAVFFGALYRRRSSAKGSQPVSGVGVRGP